MSSIVDVDSMSVLFRGTEVLKGVSLSIGEGEVACVVGPTGSGKTTLLKIVTGVLQELYNGFRVEGSIRVCGLSPSEALHRGFVAYVPQDVYSFFIGSTPREELSILGIDKCDCGVGLDTDIDKLSDGQLYRFLLYSALVSGAKLIALDEPSSHIDWWSIEDVFKHIKSFARSSRVAVMVAEHRIDLIKRFCDNVIEIGGNSSKCDGVTSLRGVGRGGAAILGENIHVVLSSKHILKGASISIAVGEAIAVVGRNGSGKTTLLSTLAGIVKPSSGRVAVYRGMRVFMIPQTPIYWFPSSTVEGVAKLFARRYGFKEGLEGVLEMFGLSNKIHKNVYSLSVGMARLFSLALAYISKADVIIVDEPTLGLDCEARALMLKALNELLEEGKAILVATHDLLFAEKFGRIYRIDNGILELLDGGGGERFSM